MCGLLFLLVQASNSGAVFDGNEVFAVFFFSAKFALWIYLAKIPVNLAPVTWLPLASIKVNQTSRINKKLGVLAGCIKRSHKPHKKKFEREFGTLLIK